MTILPLPPAPAPGRPLPPTWCYQCFAGARICSGPLTGTPFHDRPRPDTLTATAERIASRATLDAEMPELGLWDAGHIALVRAVVLELSLYADTAEQVVAATAKHRAPGWPAQPGVSAALSR